MCQRPEPANKLTPKERQDVLTVCNLAEYASLPPSQIVPDLLDKKTYVASESSFYRILKLKFRSSNQLKPSPKLSLVFQSQRKNIQLKTANKEILDLFIDGLHNRIN